MYFVTNCAISGKKMKMSNDVVFFPCFDAQPDEPEFVYSESSALRSEFEKWDLRDRIIKRVRNFWIQWSHEERPISILTENQSFLIVAGTIEKKVSLFFLDHVFSVDFTTDSWQRFVNLMLTTKKGYVTTIEKDRFSWNIDTAKGNVVLKNKSAKRDSIVIPIAEWRNLQELLSATK